MPGVLIVDDHATFRATARQVLEAAGFDVVGEAADGASALEAFARLRPDVVLLDVQLPDMDGFEVSRQLSGNGARPKIVPDPRAETRASSATSSTAAAPAGSSRRASSPGETGSAPGVKTRSILGVWTLALALAAIAILIIATSDHTNDKLALILVAVPIELAFVASGLVARAAPAQPNRVAADHRRVQLVPRSPSVGQQRVPVHRGSRPRHVLHRAPRALAARVPDRWSWRRGSTGQS